MEEFKKAVKDASFEVNPKMSSSPLSDLAGEFLKLPAGSSEVKMRLVPRLVLYSRAPPAMMHVNHLRFYAHPPADNESASLSTNFDVPKFLSFFQCSGKSLDLKGIELSTSMQSEVDSILRKAFLETAMQLESQFYSHHPPTESLMKGVASGVNRPMDESSVDDAFSAALNTVLVKNDKSQSLIDSISTAIYEFSKDSGMQMAIAERQIFCSMPHPEAFSGSDSLRMHFKAAISSVKSELSVDTQGAVEVLAAAIDRLPAVTDVKLLLKQFLNQPVRRSMPKNGQTRILGSKTKHKVKSTSETEPKAEGSTGREYKVEGTAGKSKFKPSEQYR